MKRIALLSAVLIVTAFAASAQTNGTLLTCESVNNVRHTCRADVASGVTLNRQFSKDACLRGKTWGTTRENNGIWVDAGCRAEFLIGGGSAELPNGALQTVTCESIPGHTKHCTAMTANGVQMVRQLSKHGCVLNKDWGWDNNGVWVKNGCRAEFTTSTSFPPPMASSFSTITCESSSGMNHRCAANTMSGVTLSRQLSDSGCVQGKTWGYDESGIWVSNGCRAEFMVGR